MEVALITAAGLVLAAMVTAFGLISVAKLNQIHRLANSNLAAANARLDTALSQISELNRLITEMRTPSAVP
jgi:hypothetical protein